MKCIIVGMHNSGKHDIVRMLRSYNIRCGNLFTNDNIKDDCYDVYSDEDITSIFENQAYIFFKEKEFYLDAIYEGLSLYEWDNNDVFILTPEQFNSIIFNNLSNDVCVVWLDDSKSFRKLRYNDKNCSYDFNNEEEKESQNIDDFIKNMYNKKDFKILYFNDEEPLRIGAIVYSIIKHQDLINIYEKNFN